LGIDSAAKSIKVTKIPLFVTFVIFVIFVIFVLIDVDGFDGRGQDRSPAGEQLELKAFDNPSDLHALVVNGTDQLGFGALLEQLASGDRDSAL